MMVRLDFSAHPKSVARTMRVSAVAAPGVHVIALAGVHLPFRDGSVDEIFLGRTIMYRDDMASTLDEIWRACKPGALIHVTLPHASSTIAASRDAQTHPLLTLNTFNYYDPRSKPRDASSPTAFVIERAHLRVAAQRGDDSGLALARGPLTQFIEKLANGTRGSQYRFERWFAGLFGGFEEFDVVLSVVKQLAAPGGTSFMPAIAENGFGGVSDR